MLSRSSTVCSVGFVMTSSAVSEPAWVSDSIHPSMI